MRALATGVSRTVECPEERDGRTVYFDWLGYVAGLFEGRQICCQIVTVPGQRELDSRRQLLLNSGDAVVCVLDTRCAELEFGLSWLSTLLPACRDKEPPVGVVLQANKRDAHDAVPHDQLRSRLGRLAQVAVVDAVATCAHGIREAFVLAVRLALDRVRVLSASGQLTEGAPPGVGPAALLAAMRGASDHNAEATVGQVEGIPELAAPARTPAGLDAASDPGDEQLFVPDPSMPGGMIWPPVDRRTLLHQVAALGIRPARTARGDWWGSGAGWRFHSTPHALYSDMSTARDKLIQWARLHAANTGRISHGRAVILADAGGGRLRLWQLVRIEATLRERLDTLLTSPDAARVAEGLHEVAAQLLTAQLWFAEAGVALRCSLWTVCASKTSRPVYVGLMPEVAQAPPVLSSAHELLVRELLPQLRELRRSRLDYGAVTRELHDIAQRTPTEPHVRTLAQLAESVG